LRTGEPSSNEVVPGGYSDAATQRWRETRCTRYVRPADIEMA
jgi:hypothetical protein